MSIPPHADVRIICQKLYEMEQGLKNIGLIAPVLSEASDMLSRMSHRLAAKEQHSNDDAEYDLGGA